MKGGALALQFPQLAQTGAVDAFSTFLSALLLLPFRNGFYRPNSGMNRNLVPEPNRLVMLRPKLRYVRTRSECNSKRVVLAARPFPSLLDPVRENNAMFLPINVTCKFDFNVCTTFNPYTRNASRGYVDSNVNGLSD